MKTILFARHAKSDWNQPGYSDFDRPLNPKGETVAPVMASEIQKKYSVDQIISSDAARAIATAMHYKNSLTPQQELTREHLLYNASHLDIASVVNNISNAYSSVMLVGHNPGMTDIVNYYAHNSIDDMPTCSVAVVQFAVNEWKEIMQNMGTLMAFETPNR